MMEPNVNESESRNRLANGIRMATLVVVVGTIAAVWHPVNLHEVAVTAKDAAAPTTSATPDMSVYFPARFAAPENEEPQAPTF
jgi:hypothetical protein